MKIEFSGMLDGEAKKFAVKQFHKYRVNLAITNNPKGGLFRGVAVSGISDTNRTSPTT